MQTPLDLTPSTATLIVTLEGDFTTAELTEIMRTQFHSGNVAPPCLGGRSYKQSIKLHSAMTRRK
jgi:hypothetical protein